MNTEELRQRLTLIVAETPVNQCWTLSTVHLLKLVEDAVEAEREACAKVCEELVLAYAGNASATANQCADAIRANRSQTATSVFISNAEEVTGEVTTQVKGDMTLRDYFAAKAMQAYIYYGGSSAVPRLAAKNAYAMAEEMLEARLREKNA